ncbi:hypothetical protein ACVIGB_005246 [Bradyrhizobium sp. USDA 4341]
MTAEAHKDVLESGDWLTSAQVTKMTGFSTSNPSGRPNKWKKAGQIFAVRSRGVDYFPGYALDASTDHRPAKGLAGVLDVFRGRKDNWGLAYWFASVNGFLGGKRPQDLLIDQPRSRPRCSRGRGRRGDAWLTRRPVLISHLKLDKIWPDTPARASIFCTSVRRLTAPAAPSWHLADGHLDALRGSRDHQKVERGQIGSHEVGQPRRRQRYEPPRGRRFRNPRSGRCRHVTLGQSDSTAEPARRHIHQRQVHRPATIAREPVK